LEDPLVQILQLFHLPFKPLVEEPLFLSFLSLASLPLLAFQALQLFQALQS
jgi:hypothetical protein